MEVSTLKILNREQLKFIAIIAMTMDHIAACFFTRGTALWFIFRTIGRITFPLMAYMLAEGFIHTRNLKKYVIRMFLFSVISWFSFSFLETGSFIPVRLMAGNYTDYPFSRLYIQSLDITLCICLFSVITGLLCSLLALTVWEKTKWKLPFKILATCGLVLITFNSDWCWLNIPTVMCFYYFRNNRPARWIGYTALTLSHAFTILLTLNIFEPQLYGGFKVPALGMLIALILIEFFFNGKKGNGKALSKWFFYIYYPAHQVVLGILLLLLA